MRLTRQIGALLLVGCALTTAGCSTTQDPHYNPYASPIRDQGALDHAEDALGAAEQALDNLDARLENIIY